MNPEDKRTSVKCIMAMNRSIKKMSDLTGENTQKNKLLRLSNHGKVQTLSSVSENQVQNSPKKAKKNLVQMTEDVRK